MTSKTTNVSGGKTSQGRCLYDGFSPAEREYYVFTTYRGSPSITANKLYPVERFERDDEGDYIGAYITLDDGGFVLILIGDKYNCAFLEDGYTWTLTEKH